MFYEQLSPAYRLLVDMAVDNIGWRDAEFKLVMREEIARVVLVCIAFERGAK
jgi:hypothetical protein